MTTQRSSHTWSPVTTRSNANIHISETAFSIPDSYQVTVVDSRAETNCSWQSKSNVEGDTKIDIADYPFLAEDVVSAVKPDPDSTAENPPLIFADNKVWWVKAENEPGTNDDDNVPPEDRILQRPDEGWRTGILQTVPTRALSRTPRCSSSFGAVHVLVAGAPVETHVVGADFFAFEERAIGHAFT